MSLMDAMLNEGYRDPRDVYIALRTDGAKGAGTIDDPYDGGTRIGRSLAGSVTLDRRDLILTHGVPHDFDDGWKVELLGANGPFSAFLHDLLSIDVVNSTDFKVHLGGVPIAPPADSDLITGRPVFEAELAWTSGLEVTVTTKLNGSAVAHKYPDQTQVEIRGATGTYAARFNGTFAISLISGQPTIFKYTMRGDTAPEGGPQGNAITCRRAALYIFRFFWPVARATTQAAHDYGDYAAVMVANATPSYFNGDFVIVGANSANQAFWYPLRTLPDADTTSAVAVSCGKVIHRFDEVMRGLPTHCRIHVGPGTFETRGATPAYIASGYPYEQLHVGFNVKTAQKITGSGMGATTLKLVCAVDRYNNTAVFRSFTSADYFEASDLTVDGNAAGQPVPVGCVVAPVVCGAVWVGGSHTRIRRVRAIHCGTQNIYSECFVIATALSGPDVGERVNCVLEECVVEQPSENTVRETTCLAFLGEPNRASVMRHCFVNAQFANGVSSHPISIKWAGGLTPVTPAVPRQYLLETDAPHHRIAGQNVTINYVYIWKWDGIDEHGQNKFRSELSTTFNGPFAVDWVSGDGRQLKITLKRNPDIDIDWANGKVTVEGGQPLSITAIESLDAWPVPLAYRIVTGSPHNWQYGMSLVVSDVKLLDAARNRISTNAFTDSSFANIEEDDTYVTPGRALRVRLSRNPEAALNLQNSTIGNAFQVGGNPTGTGGVQEGNWVFGAARGYYSDTGSGLDGITRDNIYYDIYTGGYLLLGNVSGPIPGKLTCSPGSLFVTFECTQFPHGLWPGATIRIVPQLSPVLDPELQGKYFEINSVPGNLLLNGRPSTFVFKLAVPLSNPPSGTTASVQEYYRARQFTAESNFIVLAPSLRADCAATAGFNLGDMGLAPGPKPFIYRRVILKNNIVSQPVGFSDLRANGAVSDQIENGAVQENALRLTNPHLLYHLQSSSGAIDYLANQGIAGELTQGERRDPTLNFEKTDELETRIEDAMIMAL